MIFVKKIKQTDKAGVSFTSRHVRLLLGLEACSVLKCTLLFQRTQAWFLATTSGSSQPPVCNLSSRDQVREGRHSLAFHLCALRLLLHSVAPGTAPSWQLPQKSPLALSPWLDLLPLMCNAQVMSSQTEACWARLVHFSAEEGRQPSGEPSCVEHRLRLDV